MQILLTAVQIYRYQIDMQHQQQGISTLNSRQKMCLRLLYNCHLHEASYGSPTKPTRVWLRLYKIFQTLLGFSKF